MGYETIKVEKIEAVCRITLNRPEKRNAQNPTLINEMDAAFQDAAADAGTRVVILTGEEPAFSAGHDLEYPGFDRKLYTLESRLEMERQLFVEKMLRIRNLPKPTIAQVHGHCVAAGLMLACMCDLIVCDETAKFSNPVVLMALAGVQLLVEPWEIGARKAKELLFTGEVLSAEEACRLGLVNRVVPRERLAEEVLALARRIARLPPFVVQTVKKSINDTLDFMGQSRSWEHHFLLHLMAKRSREYDEWWTEAEREGGGFKAGGVAHTLRKRDITG